MNSLLKPLLIIFFIAFILFIGCKKNATSPVSSKTTQPPPVISSTDTGLYTTTEIGGGLSTLPDFSKSINGYTDKITYQQGDSVSLYISGPRNNHQLIALTDVNNKVVFSVNAPIALQTINTQKPWVDGLMFKKTITIKLPNNLKSGIYYWFGKAPIVCKDKSPIHDIVVVYPTNTINAYNLVGGKDLYYPANARSTVVSFLRFQDYAGDYSSGFLKWVSNQSYDINYVSDADLDNYAQIQNAKVVIIIGHSEYWTRQARENIDKFVASGKNLLVLSGNTMCWQVRYDWNKSLMICYKDNNLDPLRNTMFSTTSWDNTLLQYPINSSIGVNFESGGYGNRLPNRWNGYKIVLDNSPLLSGTGLKNGDILNIPSLEYDGAPVVKMISPDLSEIPVIDNKVLNFYKIELLGYDWASSFAGGAGAKGLGTFIVFKKTQTSGTIVNAATTDWCSTNGIGGTDKTKIQIITKNMIDGSLNNSTLFAH